MRKETDRIVKSNRNQILIDLILDDDNKIPLDNHFREMIIHKDKNNNVKPIIKINLSLPMDLIKTYQESKNSKFYIQIFSSAKSEETIIPNDEDLELKKVFDFFLIPYTNSSKSLTELDNQNIKDSNMNSFQSMKFTIEGFMLENITTDKKLINKIYRNLSLKEIVGDLIALNFNKIKAVISPFENNEILSEVFIKPMCFFETLKFLDTNYNMYSTKPLFFIDKDILYITKSRATIKEKNKKSIINILCQNAYASETSKEILKTLKNEKVYIVKSKSEILDNTISAMNEFGTKVAIPKENDNAIKAGNCVSETKPKVDSMVFNEKYIGKEKYLPSKNLNAKFQVERRQDLIERSLVKASFTIEQPLYNEFSVTSLYNLIFTTDREKKYNGLWQSETLSFIYTYNTENSDISARVYMNLSKIVM